jgi:TonB-linked SusC/RagA family outer membrane protein
VKVRNLLSLLLVALALTPVSAAAQQTGRIVGTVTTQGGQPLSGVWVSVQGTNIGVLTATDGRYALDRVPAGTHTLVTRHIGYADATQRGVVVTAGQTATVDLKPAESVLSLQEVIVTGVQDPVAGVKAPFAIARVSAENVATVPSTKGALASIQGKVAGAYMVQATGEPGVNNLQIVLRTPTSIQQSITPLIVVDGIITSTTSLLDMDAGNIESVEVVKGAAASSLYGSRAAAGVISIRTNRGRNLALDQTQITVRNEMGKNYRWGGYPLATRHFYKMNDQGQFLKADGTVAKLINERAVDDDRVMDNNYPGTLYTERNLDAIFRAGDQQMQTMQLSHFAQSTNFLASITRQHTQGAVVNNDGATTLSMRLNLDHRLRDDFSFAVTAMHSRAQADRGDGGSIFFDVLRTPPDIDLAKKDANGNFIQLADSSYLSENPAWRQGTRDNVDRRYRTQLATDVRYNPFNWLNVSADVGYDRFEGNEQDYTPKGTPNSVTNLQSTTDGSLDFAYDWTDRLNAGLSVNLLHNFGDLTTRTTLRTQWEREKAEGFDAGGDDFSVGGVRDLSWVIDPSIGSSSQDTKTLGYYIQTGLDYAGKYIVDGVLRTDGSSRFGANERWHTYGRGAAAWRMAQEDWWPVAQLTEFKLRYALGIAGNPPGFTNQYEVWSSSNGLPNKSTLGNPDLKPERTIEQEIGLDMILNNKYQLQLTYAKQITQDQIIQMTVPATSGYPARFENAGEITGTTLEATLEAQIINRPNMRWAMTLVADRSRGEITGWDRACLGAANSLGITCLGVQLGDMYVNRLLRSKDNLPRTIAQYADQFDINDEGYLVWVGQGRTWRDGFSETACAPAPRCWGQTTSLQGYPTTVRWGMPLVELDSAGFFAKLHAGTSVPDAQLGLMNNLDYHGFSINMALRAQIGGETYNNTKRNLFTSGQRHADIDQTGKPREMQKPIDYYTVGFGSGETFANTHFIEDASFLKISSIAVTYTFNRTQLNKIGLGRFANTVGVGLTGQNLATFTNYTGYDPEVGGIFFRVDQWYYPPPRTLTGRVEITF